MNSIFRESFHFCNAMNRVLALCGDSALLYKLKNEGRDVDSLMHSRTNSRSHHHSLPPQAVAILIHRPLRGELILTALTCDRHYSLTISYIGAARPLHPSHMRLSSPITIACTSPDSASLCLKLLQLPSIKTLVKPQYPQPSNYSLTPLHFHHGGTQYQQPRRDAENRLENDHFSGNGIPESSTQPHS
jgi:hypothetical protein